MATTLPPELQPHAADAAELHPVLRQALHEKKVEHPDGRLLDVTANISERNSRALHRLIRERRPKLVVEIGMAYGVSTLTILSALAENGSGRLISIDPYEGWPTGRKVALHQVARAGLDASHEYIDAPSYVALPDLLARDVSPDLVYIDGNHNFDYVFTDWFHADKLLPAGGVIGFNDSGWQPVYKVIRCLRKYRRYRELDVGLPRVYTARNPLFSLIKRLEGRSVLDRYFEKVERWEPGPGFHRWF